MIILFLRLCCATLSAQLSPNLILQYDSRNGFRYGASADYIAAGANTGIYAEVSLFSKGSRYYDLSVTRILNKKGLSLNIEASYLKERGVEFYGFNGYDADAVAIYEPDFYKIDRATLYTGITLRGHIVRYLRWGLGATWHNYAIGDYGGKQELSRYRILIEEGVIPDYDAAGGKGLAFNGSLQWNNTPSDDFPTRGIMAGAKVVWSPSGVTTGNPYLGADIRFTQYVPLFSENLVFAWRVLANGFLQDPSFYVLPYDNIISESSLRGILRNRIQGRSVVFANTEIRYKAIDTAIGRTNIKLVLNAFCDGGRAIVPYSATTFRREGLHLSAGGGARLFLPGNAALSVEYGIPFDARDSYRGEGGGIIYIHTGYWF